MTAEQLTLAVPNLNGATFLEHTLRSLAQNRPYVRWRFQDGESTDNSAPIAKQWASAVDEVAVEPDQGQADAINRALEFMGGEVIGFLNSDDELAEGAAAAVVDYFRTHPDIDIVYGSIEWIDEAGRATGRHTGRIETCADILDIYNVWWNHRQWVQPEVFFRRSLWERVGSFDTRYRLAFDYDYWVRCFLAGAKVAHLPGVLARFRLHAGQKSRAAAEAAREIRAIVEQHLPAAPIPHRLARRLQAQIDYERYHLGEGRYANGKPTFLSYLLSHPRAWALPAVWQRLRLSVTKPDRFRRPA